MGYERTLPIETGLVRIHVTDRSDGDFRIRDPAPDVDTRRRAVVDAPWTWIHQVHGTTVLTVDHPGHHAGAEADGLATARPGCPISVTTADCAPIVLVAEAGVAVLHAGWRGLLDGIVEQGGDVLGRMAGEPVEAIVGPCIHPEAYEFGHDELAAMVDRFGDGVVGRTDRGTPALDMPEAVHEACRAAGWSVSEVGPCTSSPSLYSHRTRHDVGRLATVAWIDTP